MTVLVTGATGFIGRLLVDRLLADGEAVRVLVTSPANALDAWRDRVEISIGDLRDPVSLTSIVSGVTTVYHLAGEIRRTELFTPVNVDGTRNLLNACATEGSIRFLHMSSVGVIGARRSGEYNEASVCQPRDGYEFSKLRGEQLALDFGRSRRLQVTVVRPTIVFGARPNYSGDSFFSWLRVIQSGRFRIIGSGDGAANYVYVEDVVAACVYLARVDAAFAGIYHIADPCTIKDLVSEAARLLNVPLPGNLPRSLAYAAALGFQGLRRLKLMTPSLTLSRVRALTSHQWFSGRKLQQHFVLPIGWRTGLKQTIEAYRAVQLLD